MIASLSEFDSPRLSLHSGNESKKRSMIKELRGDYRNCFNNSALSSTAKRFSPTTLQSNVTGFARWRIQFNLRGGETFTFGRFRITIIKSLHSPGGLYMEDITAASTVKKGLTKLFMLAFLWGQFRQFAETPIDSHLSTALRGVIKDLSTDVVTNLISAF
jgi:hypothetical protein